MAEETRGVFTLKTVRNNILNDEFVTPDEAFFGPQVPNSGYMLGGSAAPGNVSTTDKIDFTLDVSTAVPGANLTSGRFGENQGSSTNTAGYTVGGKTTPSVRVSTVDKLTYSTDTTANVPSAELYALWTASGSGNNLAGYFCGSGSPGGPPIFTYCQKLTYSTETSALAPSANLTATRYNTSSTGNQIFGYWIGGTPGPNSTADKLTYGTDTMSAVTSARLPTNGYGRGTSANQTTAIYAGGATPGQISNIEKVNFSDDTSYSVPAAQLTVSRAAVGGSGNSVSGYYYGGYSPSRVTTTDKLSYASDTVSVLPGAQLSVARDSGSSMSGRNNIIPNLPQQNLKGESNPNTGYTGGGYNGSGAISTVNKLYFNTDTIGAVGNYSLARYYVAGTGNLTAGYGGGGRGGAYSTMDKTTYSTDTSVAVPAAALSSARYGCSALGTKEFGYFAGGEANPGLRSLTDKLTYATDTRAQLPGTNLTEAGNFQSDGGSGNQGKGYVAGFPSTQTKIDRLDYSTETFSTVTGAQLSSNRPYQTTVSNSESGYFAGGYTGPQYSTVDKLNFSTETLSASFPMVSNRSHSTSAGNESNAYIIGSQQPGLSSTEKISYTTDAISLLPSANTPTSTLAGAAGNSASGQGGLLKRVATPTLGSSIPGSVSNNGYIAGGISVPGTVRSDVEKLIFATDTVQYLPSTQLSGARFRQTGTSSSTAGYFGGGFTGSARVSTMDKLTFSTDTIVAVSGAALRNSTYGAAAASCSTHGYFAGGAPGGPYRSATDKLTFSSDTTATAPSAQLEQELFFGDGGSASSTAAYMAGCVNTPGTSLSSVAKISFSNDTRNQVPSAALIATKYAQAAGHNTTHAYFTGGASGGAPSVVSTASKITFATETTQQSANYPIRIYEHSACGNAVSGYFSNGNNPATDYISAIYKLNYTTETFGLMGVSFLSQGNAVSASLSAKEGGAAYTSNTL